MIGALQLFDQAVIARRAGGDPNNALMTVVLYLYNAAFSQFNFGYAAAVGVILFVIIFGATLVQRRLFGAGARRGDPGPRRRDGGRRRPSASRATPATATARRVRRRPDAAGARRLVYVFLIGYAILMFIPFAWSVITSFKTLPDSVQLTIIPQPFTLDA